MLAMLITRSDSLLNCEPAQWGRWREWRLIWGRDEPHQDQKAQPVKETMHDLNSKVGKKGGEDTRMHSTLAHLLPTSLIRLPSHLCNLGATT